MKTTALLFIAVLIATVACQPAPTATPAPTVTPLPSPTTAATATPPPPRVTADNTALYAGPGNFGYETLAQLAAGTQVSPVGIYGEFVKVAVGGTAKEGFVLNKYLENLPSSVPALAQEQLPWAESLNALNLPAWNQGASWVENGKVKLDNSAPSGFKVPILQNDKVAITGPFAIQVQFAGQGAGYGVHLWGRLNSGGDWWSGLRRLDIMVNNENLGLFYNDGTSANAQRYNLPKSLISQRFTLRFDESGSTVIVLDQNGKPTNSDPFRLSAPLFPDKVLFFGLQAGPKSSLEVSILSVRVPPSGKFSVATPTPTVRLTPTPQPTSTPVPLLGEYVSTTFTETKISYVRPVGWRENRGVRKSQDGVETFFADYYWPPSGNSSVSFRISCYPFQSNSNPVPASNYSRALSEYFKDQGYEYLEEFTASVDSLQGPITVGGLNYRNNTKSLMGISFMLTWPERGKACHIFWQGETKYEKELKQLYTDMLPKFKFGQ